ncbi:hypothetical protein ACQ4PT_006379 [Festuca glaucescens]
MAQSLRGERESVRRTSARPSSTTPAAAATLPAASFFDLALSARWSDMVEEEEEQASSESSSRHSYSDVVRDGSPSSEREPFPMDPRLDGSSAQRPQPVRRLASMVLRPVSARVDAASSRYGHGGRRGPQPKRQRHRGPLPSLAVPEGVPAGLAGLCFNCVEPGHVAGMCKGKRRCLICKSELHVARQCTAPVADAVAVGAPPPPPRAGVAPSQPPAPRAPPAPTPRPPPPPALPRARPSPVLAPAREPVGLYRVLARQCLGAGGDVAAAAGRQGAARPSIKERQGVREPGAVFEVRGRDVVAPAFESPFERGLRRERELRATSPRRPEEVAAGESLYDRGLRRERELRDAALSSVERAVEVEAARPVALRCIIYRTAEVAAAERALRWGLVAFVSGTRRLSKKLWLAEPMLFGEEDDDLLLPVDALVPEEVALLEYEATVHSMRVEGDAGPAGHPGSDGTPDDDQDGDPLGPGGRTPVVVRLRTTASCRVLLALAARLRSHVPLEEEVPLMDKDAALSPLTSGGSPVSVEAGGDGASCAGQKVDLAAGSSPSPASSASIQAEGPWWWPKGVGDGTLSPTGLLSPTSSACSLDSFEGCGQWTQASMFTVELSRASPPEAQGVEVEEGEIVEATPSRPQPEARPALPSTPTGSSSVDTDCALAAFRERCRSRKAALLPRPVARKPRGKRWAGHFAPGTPIKQQQKTLMIQLEIAREGEVIGEEALQAYLRYFKEKPMTTEHLTACLDLFGWQPSVLPTVEDGDVDVVV